jgi:hypothetical protein
LFFNRDTALYLKYALFFERHELGYNAIGVDSTGEAANCYTHY